VAIVIGTGQVNRCSEVGKTQFFPPRFSNVERFEAAADVFAIDLLLAGQLLRVRIASAIMAALRTARL